MKEGDDMAIVPMQQAINMEIFRDQIIKQLEEKGLQVTYEADESGEWILLDSNLPFDLLPIELNMHINIELDWEGEDE